MRSEHDEMQEDSNSYDSYRMDVELDDFKSKLHELRGVYEKTEMKLHDVSQLKDKGLFVQKNIQRKYENVAEELKEVHCNYLKCISKVNSQTEIDNQRINSLTLKRDNLKKELLELKSIVNENNKKLAEIKKIISIQEKKNIASVRKLKGMMNRMSISQNLKEKINTVLSDRRITKRNLSD